MIAFFYGLIAVFFGTLLIAGILSNDDINGTKPSSVSPRRQKETHEEVTRLHTAQHLGDEADQYAYNLLSHFRSGGVCDTYSSMIRRFTDTGSSVNIRVNIRITKIHKIMDNTHKHNSRSKQELSDPTFKKPVAIRLVDIDRYQRIVGRIYVEDLVVSAEMVRRGAAWIYRKYVKDQNLYKLEDEASDDKRGLWGLPEALRVPPWEWRRR